MLTVLKTPRLNYYIAIILFQAMAWLILRLPCGNTSEQCGCHVLHNNFYRKCSARYVLFQFNILNTGRNRHHFKTLSSKQWGVSPTLSSHINQSSSSTVSINLFHSNKLTWFTTLFPASSWFDFNFLIRLVHFLKNVIVCRIHFALNSLWWFSTFNCHYAFDAKMSYFNCFLILLIYWLLILKWNLIHSLYSLHVPSIANVA